MDTLKDLGALVREVRCAKRALHDAEMNQARFVVANAEELIGRGVVSIKIKEGRLFQQMEHEMGRETTLRVLGG